MILINTPKILVKKNINIAELDIDGANININQPSIYADVEIRRNKSIVSADVYIDKPKLIINQKSVEAECDINNYFILTDKKTITASTEYTPLVVSTTLYNEASIKYNETDFPWNGVQITSTGQEYEYIKLNIDKLKIKLSMEVEK